MTDAWDGLPPNPERSDHHWLLHPNGQHVFVDRWMRSPQEWFNSGPPEAASVCTYLGPCLLPTEVEAEKILAREEGRIAGFEEAMDDLRDAPPLGVNRHGVMYLSPPEVEARVAAARREGIEAAIEAAMRVPIPEDASVAEAHGRLAAAQDICARIGALLEDGR